MLRLWSRVLPHSRIIAGAMRPAVERGLGRPQGLLCPFSTQPKLTFPQTSILTRLTLIGAPATPIGASIGAPVTLIGASAPQSRSVTKWSLQKGKRKTVRAVLSRFKRLHWEGRGIWIRARQGAKKRIWRKSKARRIRCKTHVFCNATQSTMLDKMVTRYWKKMRHYPNDPYKPYMQRHDFHLTRRYPKEYF